MENTCSPAAAPEACREALSEHLRPELFRALCDPSRIAVISRLAVASGPLTVTGVADCCGVHISGVSRHLATLRDAGVVQADKRGREVRYRLDCEHLGATLRGLAAAFDACRAVCCHGERHDPSEVPQ